MDSITANYFALFEVINHSFGKPVNPPGADERGSSGVSTALTLGFYLSSHNQEPRGGIGWARSFSFPFLKRFKVLSWVFSQAGVSFPAGHLHLCIVTPVSPVLLLQQTGLCRKRFLRLFVPLTRFWLNHRADF